MEGYLIPQLQHRQILLQNLWLQQDGARPHTAAATLTRLQEAFPGKVLSNGGFARVATPVPRLVNPRFLPVGPYLGQGVPKPGPIPQRIEAPHQAHQAAIRAVEQATLKAALEVLPLRAKACLRLSGGYLETILTHYPVPVCPFHYLSVSMRHTNIHTAFSVRIFIC